MTLQQDLARFPYPVGSKVRDKVTGFEGTAVAFAVKLGAMPQVWVEPSGDGKSAPDTHAFDVARTEVMEAGSLVNRNIWHSDIWFDLGEEVVDKLSGLKGRLSERVYYLNGCIHYTIVFRSRDFGTQASTLSQDRLRPSFATVILRLIKKIPVRSFSRQAAPQNLAFEPPGGPTTRIARKSVSRS